MLIADMQSWRILTWPEARTGLLARAVRLAACALLVVLIGCGEAGQPAPDQAGEAKVAQPNGHDNPVALNGTPPPPPPVASSRDAARAPSSTPPRMKNGGRSSESGGGLSGMGGIFDSIEADGAEADGNEPTASRNGTGSASMPSTASAPPQRCAELGVIVDGEQSCIDYETVLAGLKSAPLAYNRPERMVRDRVTDISLVIDPTVAPDPAGALSEFSGEPVEAETKIARHMSARLSGAAFEITPDGFQKKLISAAAPTQWVWGVVPREGGSDKVLTLEVFAHVVAGERVSEPVTLRTFHDKIVVDVSTLDWLNDIISKIKPIYAFIATVIAGLAGAFVWIGKRRRGD